MKTTKRVNVTASGVFYAGSAEGVIVADANVTSSGTQPAQDERILGTQIAFATKVVKRAIGIGLVEPKEANR